MENQHRNITGYRELTEREIDFMNHVKAYANELGDMFERLSQESEIDKRWLAIAKTQLQQGFMALTRSIARPTSF